MGGAFSSIPSQTQKIVFYLQLYCICVVFVLYFNLQLPSFLNRPGPVASWHTNPLPDKVIPSSHKPSCCGGEGEIYWDPTKYIICLINFFHFVESDDEGKDFSKILSSELVTPR